MSSKQTLNFIGNEFIANQSGRFFENRSPVDGRLVSMVAEAGRPEVDAAVQAARGALRGPWAR
jgi:aminomuconate-semialdehyde/2-hydroxymuconate-6-semialdehyde dehydrogenase